MRLELTEQQQETLAREEHPMRQVDPKTNTTYVLVPEEDYDLIQETLQEERHRKHIAEVAMRNATGRMEDGEGKSVTEQLNEVYSKDDSSMDPVIRRLGD